MAGTPIQVTVDVRDAVRGLGAISETRLTAALRAGVGESLATLRGTIVAKTPANTGLLRGSIVTTMNGTVADAVEGSVGSPLIYASVVELGRRPGMRPPPFAAILLWVQQRGRSVGTAVTGQFRIGSKRRIGTRATGQSEDERAAWAIRAAIARRGIPGTFMFTQTARTAPPIVRAILLKHLQRLTR